MIDLLKNRRSVRKYKEDKIDKEVVDKLLKAALLAPSSKNKRPVELVVVDDRETILDLKNCKDKGTLGLETAPLAIVVLGDASRSDVWVEDASVVTTLIQLEAEALGLGSCWIQIRKRKIDDVDSEEAIRNVLGVPDNFGVLAVISLGYKDEDKKAYIEDDLDFAKIHYNKFYK